MNNAQIVSESSHIFSVASFSQHRITHYLLISPTSITCFINGFVFRNDIFQIHHSFAIKANATQAPAMIVIEQNTSGILSNENQNKLNRAQKIEIVTTLMYIRTCQNSMIRWMRTSGSSRAKATKMNFVQFKPEKI